MKSTTAIKTISIVAFGVAAEKMKTNSVRAENLDDVDALKIWLSNAYPELDELKISIAVNKKIVHENMLLHDGDEVALLPPFSGG
ncbi:MAG: MoaD/ThiS family protein [Chitinophagales bacterium]|nr:MoaD/ThiS family protein [Bacteroidia bacterium]